MASSQRFVGFLMIVAAAIALASGLAALASPAAAIEVAPLPRAAEGFCRVALGPADDAPGWSQVSVSVNRSVDVDLTAGTGLTVACGTLGRSPLTPLSAPPTTIDPSIKGDFGAL